MRIGWMVPHLGCFGSIREVVELSNALIDRGHAVTIHHQEGTPCAWLPCQAAVGPTDAALAAGYDLLLLVTEWRRSDYERLLQADARVRGVVVMGFTPTDDFAQLLDGWPHTPSNGGAVLADALHREDVAVFADGPWQLEWIEQQTACQTATWLGGVNTTMFTPDPAKRGPISIGASGDPRDRKGTDTVQAAMRIVRARHPRLQLATYWGKRLDQDQLVEWYQRRHVFLDGHRRGGWCNPVFEAMACGAAVVCTDIGAVQPLAVHGETALVVPMDDAAGMADAVEWLLGSAPRIERLGEAAVRKARYYTYGRAAWRLESWLERALA